MLRLAKTHSTNKTILSMLFNRIFCFRRFVLLLVFGFINTLMGQDSDEVESWALPGRNGERHESWPPRAWHDVEGREMRAYFIQLEGDDGVFWYQNQRIHVPLELFSENSLEKIEQLQTKMDQVEISRFVDEFSYDQPEQEIINEYKLQQFLLNSGEERELPFLLYDPRLDENNNTLATSFSEDESLPIYVFLHGTEGIGDDCLRPLRDGGEACRYMFTNFQEVEPGFVLIPQGEGRGAWCTSHWIESSLSAWQTVQAVNWVIEESNGAADRRRVYIFGLSMGGRGAVQALLRFPWVYAAGVSASGMDNSNLMFEDNIRPLWVVGRRDDPAMVEQWLDGAKLRYAEYGRREWLQIHLDSGHGHDVWSKLFSEARLVQWLNRWQHD